MRNLKRMVAIVSSVVMCFMVILSTPVNEVKAATNTTNGTWITAGNFTKDWVSSGTGQDIYGHQGTASDPYEIQNEADLAALSFYSNTMKMTFEGKYINITAAELDMSQHFWTPIGETTPIYGTINGNGCNIKNLSIGNAKAYTKMNHAGLIGQSYADISNVNLNKLVYYTNSTTVGSLVGSWYGGKIDGCSADGIIFNTSSTCSIGGLIGLGQAEDDGVLGDVTNCSTALEIGSYVEANVENKTKLGRVGGLIGTLNSKTKIENCTVGIETEVGNQYYVGGVVGFTKAYTKVSNCSVLYYIYTQDNCVANSIVGKSKSCVVSATDCKCDGVALCGDDL